MRKSCYRCSVALFVIVIAIAITSDRMSNGEKSVKLASSANTMAALPQTFPVLRALRARNAPTSLIAYRNGNPALSFELNRGQADAQVKFLSRFANRTLWLTANEAVLAASQTVLRMKFVGANAEATPEGEGQLEGVVNYFVGKPSQWQTGIPTFSRVRYRGLYRGIDLIFHGNSQDLEYDFVVAPGADPGQIKLGVQGAQSIQIDKEGNLVLKTLQGELVQQKPRVYQRTDGVLKLVSGRYVVTGTQEVEFRLENYNPNVAVVIDPVLRYATFLGGSGSDSDSGTAIAVDSSNHAVVAGRTCSSDFPVTDNTKPSPSCSVFVTKLDVTGSHLIFSTIIGEGGVSNGVALDDEGNIYITGITFSGQFPTTPGAFQTTFDGAADAFVTKLNRKGTELLYSTFLGGSRGDRGNGIAVDHEGNAYVTGATSSQNFPTTPGVFQPSCKLDPVSNECGNAFVTKLNSMGTRALFSTFLGGHGSQVGNGIAVDDDGNAFVIGFTDSSDFPTTAGSAQPVRLTNNIFDTDAFVTEISSSGSHLVYSTYLGGTGPEFGIAIVLDSRGNALVTGDTFSEDFPVKNAFQSHCPVPFGPCIVVFVAKLNREGQLVYSTYLSGRGGELSGGIASTPDGQAYVTGSTLDGFPITQNAFQRVLGGARDAFLTKFGPEGELIFSTFLGGNEEEGPPAIALDHHANAYLAGRVLVELELPEVKFPVTPGAFQQQFGGVMDGFVAKVVPLCELSQVNGSVTICFPQNNRAVKSPVNIEAGTTDVTPVKLIQVFVDGNKIYEAPLSAIDVNLPISKGTHRLTVKAIDTANVSFQRTVFVKVIGH